MVSLFTQWHKTIALLPCILLYPIATLYIFDNGILKMLLTLIFHTLIFLTAHSLGFHWLLPSPCCSFFYWFTSGEYRNLLGLNSGSLSLLLSFWFIWPFVFILCMLVTPWILPVGHNSSPFSSPITSCLTDFYRWYLLIISNNMTQIELWILLSFCFFTCPCYFNKCQKLILLNSFFPSYLRPFHLNTNISLKSTFFISVTTTIFTSFKSLLTYLSIFAIVLFQCSLYIDVRMIFSKGKLIVLFPCSNNFALIKNLNSLLQPIKLVRFAWFLPPWHFGKTSYYVFLLLTIF